MLPESLVAHANEEAINLHAFNGSLDDMPDYEEVYYLPYAYEDNEESQGKQPKLNSILIYPPVRHTYGSYPLFPQHFQKPEIEKNIPKAALTIQEGAKLIDMKDQAVGVVRELIATPTTDRVTDILYEDLDGKMKRIPIHWVQSMHENSVRLAVSARLMRNVPEYKIAAPA